MGKDIVGTLNTFKKGMQGPSARVANFRHEIVLFSLVSSGPLKLLKARDCAVRVASFP